MKITLSFVAFLLALALPALANADQISDRTKKAEKRSALSQSGTKPFHLKATIAPSKESDRATNRTGDVEYWWKSSTDFRREVRSPGFHQILVVSGGHESQVNEGDYFPEWLREVAVALIEPIPHLDQVLEEMKTGEVRQLAGSTYSSWMSFSTDGNVRKSIGCTVAITDKTDLFFYGGCLGWGALFKDYKDFHGRSVARTVQSGSPEVTAIVSILEDLPAEATGLLELPSGGAASLRLQTSIIDELSLRKNLLTDPSFAWPAVNDGPLEGAITTEVVVDRSGTVREVGTILSDNPALSEFASKSIWGMKFSPYLENGQPIQVVSRITMPFKAARPGGGETFESARTYFEKGRSASFPAAGQSQPYTLHATFRTKLKDAVEEGQYTDTFQSATEWRREASIGKSRLVRAQRGEQRYESADGPDLFVLRLVFNAMEPVPAIDTFIESDWRIKRDTINGVKTIRVFAGYESPEGVPNREHARGFWFDDSGKLLKSFSSGLEVQRSEFKDFNGIQFAHQLGVLSNGALALLIDVNSLTPGVSVDSSFFELKGHKHARAFTSEVR